MRQLRRELLAHARRETKRRLHQSNNIIMNIFSTLCLWVTDTSKGFEYQKSKCHLKENFQQLKHKRQKRSQIVSIMMLISIIRTIMKQDVLNLTNKILIKKLLFVTIMIKFCLDTKIYTVYGNNYSHRILRVELRIW